MLVLSRKIGQEIVIGQFNEATGEYKVLAVMRVANIGGRQVNLSFESDASLEIDRSEILDNRRNSGEVKSVTFTPRQPKRKPKTGQ